MTNQQTATFKAAFHAARESFNRATTRLVQLESESRKLKEEILHLRRTITALAPLCSADPRMDKLGITDVCTEVMQVIPDIVSTSEVVAWIEAYGFDISSQKNAEASVHAILTRLAEDKKIEKIKDEKTGSVTWKGPGYTDDIPF